MLVSSTPFTVPGSDAREQMTWSHVGDLVLGSWVVGETFCYAYGRSSRLCGWATSWSHGTLSWLTPSKLGVSLSATMAVSGRDEPLPRANTADCLLERTQGHSFGKYHAFSPLLFEKTSVSESLVHCNIYPLRESWGASQRQ